ncbi:DUF2017 domain-containing protein [Helcobacillus massiliensis]|uniref:DUF2017 family protein n=1 Tax=Helcobacillus massiliensis TaxID=521392 RepID=A0A839QNJ9_9MICO|nr:MULTISPECIES: DUF2017 family protein [Helcobacillus]MBB3022053.1 hypothetical protein [Helcobacillus massiliensis]MCG7426920.1 DUF2017 domain-containing protein [Helcobacillus sp. ACRRO]MCT1557418.1 DUF2017 domain-containing protein [Helcobacillus massiliensis]MCT2036401.1 DUF2017 domain-containing protein [Helcobacillus massiliensis]MCT2331857.1 DUF2017 domain-containing protein [Helcobacillus massiliensis]
MAHSFVPRLDGRYMCRLDQDERNVFAQVSTEVVQLIRWDLRMDADDDSQAARPGLASDDPLARLEAEHAADQQVSAPRDGAVRRLFPSAFPDDDRAADEFRRFSQTSLAEGMIETLNTVIAALGAHELSPDEELVLDAEQADHFVRAITTIRLVLADRMGLKNDGDFEALQLLRSNQIDVTEKEDEDGVASLDFLASLYEFLSWLQESLVRAMSAGLR